MVYFTGDIVSLPLSLKQEGQSFIYLNYLHHVSF